MAKTIGVVMSERIVAGLVEGNQLISPLRYFPDDPQEMDALKGIPVEQIAGFLSNEIVALAEGAGEIAAIGIAVPGIVRHGVVEDSPNVQQLKGARIADLLTAPLIERGITAPVFINNDADVSAAGLAATKGHLGSLIRVWTLGNGVGFGRYPCSPGVWEGGHMVVTLDSKETYCGCGGRGHLEGIVGYRSMRLRFLDMEPEEIFAAAKPTGLKQGDPRCVEFVKLWHRALAAATANSIHLEGPGRFYFSGRNVNFLDQNTLEDYLHQMVKMTPLQSYTIEVVPQNLEVAVIGAGVIAEQAINTKPK